MEEKERYEFGQRTLFNNREELTTFDGFNLDDFMQIICKLLNQQSKRIKELGQENQQLKQQLHDLPKKIVEEIRDDMSKRIIEKQIKWGDNIQIGFICNAINECLDTILEKFGGEDE